MSNEELLYKLCLLVSIVTVVTQRLTSLCHGTILMICITIISRFVVVLYLCNNTKYFNK